MGCKDWKTGASLCFNKRLDAEELAAAKAAGIDCVELSFGYDTYFNVLRFPEKAEEYRAMAEAVGIELWSIHLPFGLTYDISAADDAAREATLDVQRTLIAAAARAGVKVVVIHPSSTLMEPPERMAYLVRAKESLRTLAAFAKSHGMRLAVENLSRTIVNCSDEAAFVLEGNPDVNLVFDLNHMLREDNLSYIKAVGERIITIHVSDYDFVKERHWMPLEGKIDWRANVQALEAVGYCGPWMYEVSSDEGRYTYADLKENHRKIAALAE